MFHVLRGTVRFVIFKNCVHSLDLDIMYFFHFRIFRFLRFKTQLIHLQGCFGCYLVPVDVEFEKIDFHGQLEYQPDPKSMPSSHLAFSRNHLVIGIIGVSPHIKGQN